MAEFENIPTDPEAISTEINELLEVTPASSERGRLFWLIKAALDAQAEGGGVGLPLSVPQENGIKIYDNPRIETPGVGYMAFYDPMGRFNAQRDHSGATEPQYASEATPMFYGYGGTGVGVATILEVNDKAILDVSIGSAEGNISTHAEGTMAGGSSGDKTYFIADNTGLNGYSGEVYAAYARKSTNSTVKFQIMKAAQDGTLSMVGAEIDINLSLGAGSRRDLQGDIGIIGGGSAMVVHLASRRSGSLRRTIAVIDLTTKAVTYAVNNESVFDRYYPILALIESSDLSSVYVAVNLAMSDNDDSTFELYKFTDAATAMTKVGMSSVVRGTGGRPEVIGHCTTNDTGKAIMYHGGGYVNTASIDVFIVDSNTDSLSNVSYNLGRFDNTHFTYCPAFLKYAVSDIPAGFVIGLQRKNSDQMDLLDPDTLKIWSTLNTWYCDENAPLGVLPINTVASGNNMLYSRMIGQANFNALITGTRSAANFTNLVTTDIGAPRETISTEENYLVNGVLDVKPVATVTPFMGNAQYLTMLPNVSTVVNIATQSVVAIPADAPNGAEYLIHYLKRGNNSNDTSAAYNDLRPIIGLRGNPNADNWVVSICCPKGNPTAEGGVVASVLVRKIAEGLFDYKQL
ncbi:hypothetical protein NVP1215B_053 [Vibrio phage 1.215.B._10N.222.54.F7]|nr:hypothetical protein NVP1215A_053 [Vibrio phage 1.215.A._10N.222.54.F7]AUR96076.1 hypothetical protein NVP1215B_053 [Vibrio phage 1.215.B._10N.222.54.F7]